MPVVSDSYCSISRIIPLDKNLALEIYHKFPESENTFRGIINHNDTRKKLCSSGVDK